MRARNIKPGLFKNEILGVADPLLTILFCGLWCLADKRGRLEDRPLRIKAEIFPYREGIDINGYLTELSRLGFILRYKHTNTYYIQILNFSKHQNPHHTEKDSEIPEFTNDCEITVNSPLNNGYAPADSLIPDSLIPDSLIPDSAPSSNDEEASRHPVLKFPLNEKDTFFHVHQNDIDQWQESFPGIDVMLELKKCRQWNIDNPKNRKTKNGIRKHISSWLGRAQDKSRAYGKGKSNSCIPYGAENAQ
jgi:hypothetical protein